MHQFDFNAVYETARSADPLGQCVREALDVIQSALDTYGEDHVSISFNGGKDCTVLLHLLAAVRARRREGCSSDSEVLIKSIYITCSAPFPAVENFVASTSLLYPLKLYKTSPDGMSMKDALFQYKDVFPEIRAIIIGTRRDDPHGAKLEYTTFTDLDWPPFMRIHPILNWSYQDVWTYLRKFQVPYCDLYDKGYTSLGSVHNTFPNPALKMEQGKSGSEQSEWRPAYELQDGTLERAGRVTLGQTLNDNPHRQKQPEVV